MPGATQAHTPLAYACTTPCRQADEKQVRSQQPRGAVLRQERPRHPPRRRARAAAGRGRCRPLGHAAARGDAPPKRLGRQAGRCTEGGARLAPGHGHSSVSVSALEAALPIVGPAYAPATALRMRVPTLTIAIVAESLPLSLLPAPGCRPAHPQASSQPPLSPPPAPPAAPLPRPRARRSRRRRRRWFRAGAPWRNAPAAPARWPHCRWREQARSPPRPLRRGPSRVPWPWRSMVGCAGPPRLMHADARRASASDTWSLVRITPQQSTRPEETAQLPTPINAPRPAQPTPTLEPAPPPRPLTDRSARPLRPRARREPPQAAVARLRVLVAGAPAAAVAHRRDGAWRRRRCHSVGGGADVGQDRWVFAWSSASEVGNRRGFEAVRYRGGSTCCCSCRNVHPRPPSPTCWHTCTPLPAYHLASHHLTRQVATVTWQKTPPRPPPRSPGARRRGSPLAGPRGPGTCTARPPHWAPCQLACRSGDCHPMSRAAPRAQNALPPCHTRARRHPVTPCRYHSAEAHPLSANAGSIDGLTGAPPHRPGVDHLQARVMAAPQWI